MFLARVMSILRWQGSEEVAAKMSKSWLSCQAAWGLRHVACPHLYFHHACTPASNKRVLSSGFIVSAQKRRHSHSLARRAVASAPVPALRCHSCPASWHGALVPCYLSGFVLLPFSTKPSEILRIVPLVIILPTNSCMSLWA